ncbi:MAG: phage baseplate assembly protein V [Pseudomonadota bacterium]
MAESPRTGADGVVAVHLATGGQAIPDTYQVIAVRVQAEVGRIPEAVVTLAAGDVAEGTFEEADGTVFKEGETLTIGASYGGGASQALFEGIVTGKRLRIAASRGPRLEVTARDKAIALTRARKTALHEEKSDSDVMAALASGAGLTASFETAGEARDQIQYDCTDWHFLRLLADRNGQVLLVADGKITGQAPATGDAPVLTATLGEDVIAFDASVRTEHLIAEASGRAWDPANQAMVTADGGTLPGSDWGDVTPATMAAAAGDRCHAVSTSADVASAGLTTLAKARLARSVLSAIRGRCTMPGTAKARPGTVLEIANMGKRFGGKAFVSGVEHEIAEGAWRTTAVLGLPETFASDAAGPGGLDTQGLATPILGPHIGTVQALSEDPDGKLRIKVLLPAVTTAGAAVWARYAQPYASTGAGIQFLPEVGDEVLVAFLNADPGAPVVVGSLHSGTRDRAVPVGDDENDAKVIVTRSGLKIAFDDDKKAIAVETPGGHSLTMDDDAGEVRLGDSNGNVITLGADGIAIESGGSLTAKAATALSAEAGSALDLTAGSDTTIGGLNVTCSADVAFEGTGGATGTLKGGGQAVVKGGVVMIN